MSIYYGGRVTELSMLDHNTGYADTAKDSLWLDVPPGRDLIPFEGHSGCTWGSSITPPLHHEALGSGGALKPTKARRSVARLVCDHQDPGL